MGIDARTAAGTIRLSVGIYTTERECREASEVRDYLTLRPQIAR
jgi:hypothetical protein